jgi:lipoate-protein ligase B
VVTPLKTDSNNLEPALNDKKDIKKWLCVDLPVTEYREAWDLQHKLVSARKDQIIDKNVVLFLEHPPVFTLGRRGGLDNLTVSEGFLEKTGISVIHVERGGDITYHGPGQLVVYPIIDLRDSGLRVLDYVTALEEVIIRAAKDWGVVAERSPMNRGVWIANKKLGSIGITVRRGVSFHGIAFNVNVVLEPFDWINPCGLKGISMTSMERELSHQLSMHEMREAVKRHMETVFGMEMEVIKLSALIQNHRF